MTDDSTSSVRTSVEGPSREDVIGSKQWAVCGASATGQQHEAKGLGCDDAYAYGIDGDFVVAAVADGAGSVSGTSAWGSYIACQSILTDAMTGQFVDDFLSASPARARTLMRWLFDGALERISTRADELELPIAKLATTLSVAVASRHCTVYGQIGDGIIASEHDGEITTLLVETKQDYANATWFVQSPNAFEESFRTAVEFGTTAFALSTDGMSYKITNIVTGEAYEPFFKGSWEHVRSGASEPKFAEMLRGIQDDQTGDDKTMVLAAVRWEADEFFPSPRPTRRTFVSSGPPPLPDAQRRDAQPSAQPAPPPIAPPPVAADGPAPPVEPNGPGYQNAPPEAGRLAAAMSEDTHPLSQKRWFSGRRH
ncbi:MAG: PP2C family serine/threonine-protein phosphatase [Mycobacterium sp.]